MDLETDRRPLCDLSILILRFTSWNTCIDGDVEMRNTEGDAKIGLDDFVTWGASTSGVLVKEGENSFQPGLVRFDDYLEVIDTLTDPSITSYFIKRRESHQKGIYKSIEYWTGRVWEEKESHEPVLLPEKIN
jgi:hypothetical protein